MNLNLYNILSHLIPGFLLYIAIIYVFQIPADILDPFSSAAIAYTLGYFISSISSWAEHFYYQFGKKKPYRLMAEGQVGRIYFPEYKKLQKFLSKKSEKANPSAGELFNIALRLANHEGRINEMLAHYAFARSIATACFMITILLTFKFYAQWYFWFTALTFFIFSWQRSKERGAYYVREVMMVALNKMDSPKSSPRAK